MNVVKLFADDVKVYLQIAAADDVTKLQYALDLITQWADEWQLGLSIAKCNTLSIGKTPVDAQFHIHDTELPQLSHCRDLEVVITYDLSCSLHTQQICVKAHQGANSILRCFMSGNVKLLLRAFIVYVRPMLEYNSVIWSPHLKCNIERIEKVQRQFTKWLYGFKHLCYEERLTKLNSGSRVLNSGDCTLDLKYCYKIVFGLVTLNMTDFFRVFTVYRPESYKLYKPRSDCTVRVNFFAKRVINAWNNLLTSVSFTSLPAFSRTIRSVDFRNFLKCNSC